MATPRSTSRFRERALLGAATASVGVACFFGGDAGDAGSSCPQGLPACDASSPPSYAADIAPILNTSCNGCHSAGGVDPNHDFTTWAGVSKVETTVLLQVHACTMPPADAGPGYALSPAARDELLQWLICGAPDD